MSDEWRVGDCGGAGTAMHELIEELYPICRSITGDGVRATLARVGEEIALDVSEVPTGTQVLDWTVPREWNIRDAWIKNAAGERVVDFNRCNLHVVSYSTPVRRMVPRAELDEHLHSLPEQPGLIPYRTSYYSESWGFCVSENQHKNRSSCLAKDCGNTRLAICVLASQPHAEYLAAQCNGNGGRR